MKLEQADHTLWFSSTTAVMANNGSAYRSSRFAKLPRRLGIKHIRPRTNGKAERFIQALRREWGHAFIPVFCAR